MTGLAKPELLELLLLEERLELLAWPDELLELLAGPVEPLLLDELLELAAWPEALLLLDAVAVPDELSPVDEVAWFEELPRDALVLPPEMPLFAPDPGCVDGTPDVVPAAPVPKEPPPPVSPGLELHETPTAIAPTPSTPARWPQTVPFTT
jgi:hypothetical protein